jgi:BolA protein
MSRIARHRLVHEIVHDEFENGLHALSLKLLTPDEVTR